MCHSTERDSVLSPDERRREVAAIFARDILRLHRIRQLDPAPVATESAESGEGRLEAPTPSRPYVTGS